MGKKELKEPLSFKDGRKKMALKKTPTYISGLDEILNGGLPSGRTTLVVGEPGSGKTVMGMEFIFRGVINGEPGIYLGFEESVRTFRENALTFGWNMESLEKANRLFLMEGRLDPEAVVSGKFGLKPMLSIISGKAKEIGAKRVVIDALDVLLWLFETPLQVRSELHQLNRWLAESGLTTILTLKLRGEYPVSLFQDFFYSMADCVIHLDSRVLNQVSTRRLQVIKYRGSIFGRNEYPFIITDWGIQTIPITRFELRHQPFGKRISTGISTLDDMMGGGYHQASCILLAGEPGIGKTLLASSFVRHMCSRGEKVVYFSFEESPDALIHNIKSAGIYLDRYRKAGRLYLFGVMPEATGSEEHLIRMFDAVEKMKPQHVVVDAISACERMGGKQVAFDFLTRLLNFLKERGITTLLTNQTTGTKAHIEISGNGISSMVDSVLFLSYIQGERETNRVIQVLKSRGSKHSSQVREFRIGDDGVQILDAYVGHGRVVKDRG